MQKNRSRFCRFVLDEYVEILVSQQCVEKKGINIMQYHRSHGSGPPFMPRVVAPRLKILS